MTGTSTVMEYEDDTSGPGKEIFIKDGKKNILEERETEKLSVALSRALKTLAFRGIIVLAFYYFFVLIIRMLKVFDGILEENYKDGICLLDEI